MSLTWAEHADLAEALGKVQQVRHRHQQQQQHAPLHDAVLFG
jgi:hypothetical protein